MPWGDTPLGLRHDGPDAAISHAVEHALVVVDLEPDADPPRMLAIGVDQAGKFLEIIGLEFPDRAPIVIHAMPTRRAFYDLLQSGENDS